MTRPAAFLSFAAAVLAACAHAPGAPAAEGAAAEIMRLDAAGAAAVARRDAEGTLAGFGDDAVYCRSRGVALGKDGLATAWKPWFSPDGPLVTWTPDRAGVATSGDLAGAAAARGPSSRMPRAGRWWPPAST